MSSSEMDQMRQDYNIVWMADVFFQNRWLIAASVSLFLLLACLYCVITPRVYYADAAVQVEGSNEGLLGLDALTNMGGGAASAAVEIELLKSRWLISKTIDELKLDFEVTPKFFPLIGRYLARQYEEDNAGVIAEPPMDWLSSYSWGGASMSLTHLEMPFDLIDEELELLVKSDKAFELYYDGELLGAGEVGVLFESQGVGFIVEELTARPGQVFLLVKKDRLEVIASIRSRLNIMERGRSTGFIGIGFKGESPSKTLSILQYLTNYYLEQNKARLAEAASASLQFLEGQLPVIRADMDKASERLNQYQTDKGSVNVDAETRSVLEQLVAVDAAISESHIRQVDIERRFTKNHPQYLSHIQQQRELERRKANIESQVHDLPTTQQDVLRLNRDVEVATQIYLMMLTKVQELDVVRAGTVGSVRMIDSPTINLRNPIHPAIPLILMVALLLGLVTGVALALVRAILFSRITNVADIENLNIKIFGNIPLSNLQLALEKKWRRRGIDYDRPLLSLENAHDVGVEAFKSLRTNMHFHMIATQAKVIALTGANPNIGKSFTSVNLSVVFAQTGRKVLLIDADLRKGYLHEFFSVDARSKGLSSVLTGKMSLSDALVPTAIDGLTLLPRGEIPLHPSELLMGDRLKDLLGSVRDIYDLIIVDTPPVMAVSDALMVSQFVDTTLIVARFGVNRVVDVQKTLKVYAASGLSVDGIVLNGSYKTLTNMQQGEYGYYNYYSNAEKEKIK